MTSPGWKAGPKARQGNITGMKIKFSLRFRSVVVEMNGGNMAWKFIWKLPWFFRWQNLEMKLWCSLFLFSLTWPPSTVMPKCGFEWTSFPVLWAGFMHWEQCITGCFQIEYHLGEQMNSMWRMGKSHLIRVKSKDNWECWLQRREYRE